MSFHILLPVGACLCTALLLLSIAISLAVLRIRQRAAAAARGKNCLCNQVQQQQHNVPSSLAATTAAAAVAATDSGSNQVEKERADVSQYTHGACVGNLCVCAVISTAAARAAAARFDRSIPSNRGHCWGISLGLSLRRRQASDIHRTV